MEHPDLQKQRIQADHHFTDEEANDILRRAAEIESKTAFSTNEGLSGEELERGANRAGISDDAVEAAIREREAEKKAEAEAARIKAQNRAALTKRLTIGGVIVAGALGLTLWTAQSALSFRAAQVETQRAQVEAVLQRRHDLVPNLIRATKAAQTSNSQNAQALQNLLQKTQSASSPEDKAQAESQLSEQINQALSILNQSSNSDLAARLNDSLEGAENRIAVERHRYNLAAGEYNRVARTFPASLWRPVLGYPASQPLYAADADAKTAPQF